MATVSELLRRGGPPRRVETHGALSWGFGPVGAPAVRGIDVIGVRDDVVVALTTFFAEPGDTD